MFRVCTELVYSLVCARAHRMAAGEIIKTELITHLKKIQPLSCVLRSRSLFST